MVLPHNRKALEDWQGHIYIDFSASVYTVLYLYKYLFKGAKKVKMRLTNAEDIRDDDDINLYLRGRYLCSMDAMWRLIRYQTYPSPIPGVGIIKAKLLEAVRYFMDDNKYTDMLIYFLRPRLLRNMTYTEVFNAYSVNSVLSRNYVATKIKDLDYFEISCPFINKVTHLTKRSCTKSITRMEMVYPNAGEIFYLRLILLNKPCTSFQDAKTFDGNEYPSFQLSALAHGYVDSEYEASRCFTEAGIFSTPHELRFLFATMTMEGFPTHKIFYDSITFDLMIEDYKHSATVIQSDVSYFNELLTDLSSHFSERGQTLRDYGFPEPEVVKTELEREYMKYNSHHQTRLLGELHELTPNNEEQDRMYNIITQAIDSRLTQKFFLHGKGGCGKTTLAKKLMAYTRSKGYVALGCASTGLAASIYDDFYTAHALFMYPVIEDDDKDESTSEMPFKRESRKRSTDASCTIYFVG